MKPQILSDIKGRREWALVFDADDEAMGELQRFAAAERLKAAHFTGIGAFSGVTAAWFDVQRQSYQLIDINEQVEVLSFIGDVAESQDRPQIHAHICVAKRDATAHGGHLQRGRVRPTLEVVLSESPAHLRKRFRPEFGLPLIELDGHSLDSARKTSR
jgi:uncharacterized protein